MAFYTFVGWPISIFFLSARRLIRPYVLAELFYPKTIVYEFNRAQCWVLFDFCIFWWLFLFFGCWQSIWLKTMMSYLSQYCPVLFPVFMPWHQ